MKTCPKCKMRTDIHTECEICGMNTANVPYSERYCEGYKLNKYFPLMLLKKFPYQTTCIILTMGIFIATLINSKSIDYLSVGWRQTEFAIAALVCAMFEGGAKSTNSGFLMFWIKFGKNILGALAVAVMILTFLKSTF